MPHTGLAGVARFVEEEDFITNDKKEKKIYIH
jgi:hypothetical protein